MTRTERVIQLLGLQVVRRRGTRAWAFCPFHEQVAAKAPTFFVRVSGERAGQTHCFSCKAGGGLAELVAKVRGCTLKEAKQFVRDAGKGWQPPRAAVRFRGAEPKITRGRFALPRELLLGEPIDDWPSGASRYLLGRGITQREVDAFGIGYAVDGRLAGRIIFPVYRWPNREPAGYSARSFVGDEPKYKTPDADEHADKDAMFGEHLWPPPGERHAVVVTEGAIDALSASLASGLPCGSLSGSDVHPGHVLALATFKVVVVLTDADQPGDKAARGLASSLGRSSSPRRVRLLGTDANELWRADPERLRREIMGAASGAAS